ncbi:MAG: M55 family metallopeptidase [Acidobacteria bacterium]|nr:M55 family metallopeptidase [Acidobacteriota bacterium]
MNTPSRLRAHIRRLTPIAIAAMAVAPAPGLTGLASESAQNPPRALKVFISVDMEGLAGVATSTDVNATGRDYEHFRKIMAAETNAAIEGASRAGATEIVVRDSHGGKTNLLPGDLSPLAQLIRGASTGPKNMMEGIDATFAAAIFIGYHAKAGTPNAVLAHTSNGNVVDLSINGVSLPEAGYNALVAGLYDVPVVFVAGDRAFVEQARGLLGPVEAVATKTEIGGGGISGLSPAEAQRQIRDGVARALSNRTKIKPYKLTAPYTMVLKVKVDKPLYGNAVRPRPGESVFEHADLLEILNAFNAMK